MTTSSHSPAEGSAAPTGPRTDDDVRAAELAAALMDAARAGSLTELVPFLDAGAPLDMQDANGNTMLMLAAYHGHAALVSELARRGANVDLPNDRGQTPLAGAVFKGYSKVVEVLISAGADPDAGTPSARESAQFFGREDIMQFFTK